MRRFLMGIFTTLGFITFFILLALGWFVYRTNNPSLPLLQEEKPVVLSLTLGNRNLTEQPNSERFLPFKKDPLSIQSLISSIEKAANDKRIKGILLTLEGNALKLATIQEIRQALKNFKASGKFIYTYTDTFGELSNGTKNYYLAAVSTKIWMMPLGVLNMIGISIEIPFAKKALEAFKIHPQIYRREEYKSMPESLMEENFTAPHKENLQRIINALMHQILEDIATDRSLTIDHMQKLLNTAPHLSDQALSEKLIDQVGYKDQIKDIIEKEINEKPAFISFESYMNSLETPSKGEKIAIIYAEGMIKKGKAEWNPLSEDAVMDATEVAKSIHQAGEDKTIKAIVIRIDSGGGSAIASEIISRAIECVKIKKPIIASLSNYAASGGYWIASSAHKIIALPTTLTGSIGVFSGKIVTEQLWEHYGVHWGELSQGDNAAIWSTGQPYSEIGRKKLEEQLDQIYDMFLKKVSTSRHLTREQTRQIAKGQVWTGKEAKEKKLIDELGGLTQAIEMAKKEAQIAIDTPIIIMHLPAQKTFLQRLFQNSDEEEDFFLQSPFLRTLFHYLNVLCAKPQIELTMDKELQQSLS